MAINCSHSGFALVVVCHLKILLGRIEMRTHSPRERNDKQFEISPETIEQELRPVDSKNCRLCSRTHSHDSVIFSYFWNTYFLSYGEFKMREIKLRMQVLQASRRLSRASLASGTRGALPLAEGCNNNVEVTAGKASHNASNAGGVTVGNMGCNSSIYNNSHD